MFKAVAFLPDKPAGPSPQASLVEWLTGIGEMIRAGAPLCSYEVDKAVATFHAPASGYVRRFMKKEGNRLSRGDIIAFLSDKPGEELPAFVEAPANDREEDNDFDWSEIDNQAGPPEPLSVMRRTIAHRMIMSKRHIPCFYLTTCVDMTSAAYRRTTMKKNNLRAATFNDMAIRASALALIRNPKAAAIYTPLGVIPRTVMNIGFAAALPDDGLVVPVIKNAGEKSLDQITVETRSLADKAKRGELEPEDCSGGMFSVSYLGSYDVDNFVAIVNPGEAAIAAIGKTSDAPVVIDGTIAIRPIAKITLSCDHRSIDGVLAAKLIADIKYFLENAEEL